MRGSPARTCLLRASDGKGRRLLRSAGLDGGGSLGSSGTDQLIQLWQGSCSSAILASLGNPRAVPAVLSGPGGQVRGRSDPFGIGNVTACTCGQPQQRTSINHGGVARLLWRLRQALGRQPGLGLRMPAPPLCHRPGAGRIAKVGGCKRASNPRLQRPGPRMGLGRDAFGSLRRANCRAGCMAVTRQARRRGRWGRAGQGLRSRAPRAAAASGGAAAACPSCMHAPAHAESSCRCAATGASRQTCAAASRRPPFSLYTHPCRRPALPAAPSREAFQCYIGQDAHFLHGFADAYRAALGRAASPGDALLRNSLEELLAGVEDELRLHESYAKVCRAPWLGGSWCGQMFANRRGSPIASSCCGPELWRHLNCNRDQPYAAG